jgi:hypothetical protein
MLNSRGWRLRLWISVMRRNWSGMSCPGQTHGPASLAPNLAMFVHLLQDERIVAQQDLFSVMPDTLQPGDIFAQVHEFINVPPDARPGDYVLAIGLYDSVTGQRLMIYDGGTTRSSRLTLTTVRIP